MKPLVIEAFQSILATDGHKNMLRVWLIRKRRKCTVVRAYNIYLNEVQAYNYRYRNEK